MPAFAKSSEKYVLIARHRCLRSSDPRFHSSRLPPQYLNLVTENQRVRRKLHRSIACSRPHDHHVVERPETLHDDVRQLVANAGQAVKRHVLVIDDDDNVSARCCVRGHCARREYLNARARMLPELGKHQSLFPAVLKELEIWHFQIGERPCPLQSTTETSSRISSADARKTDRSAGGWVCNAWP